ncbi:flagellar hook-associated protein FlgK [Clostridium sp. Cult1]|uniref:flagellar hook-associated protein FlgK n=1 Tax=Clostridium sp. Cult1 TaxID=2079002 RepID=UPI001F02245C|nr:flagellar hook-associated protein FlgK [Clostridium sp. Cult1]MCF6463968.1 flagellar hook-associated protein FlgK [Clostridium sp. Cult1]
MSFGGLYISISGINANKKALDTVSHNIANVNNRNYVRQGVIHAESSYSTNTITRYQMGSGVDVQQIRQIRDEFLDAKLRREMATFGYYNTKSEILNEIEVIFNEITSSGLQEVMDDFWDGWSELYKEPDSLTIRGLLHEKAVAFTTTVNHISVQLDSLQFNLNKEMLNKTEEVNTLLKEIAGLNNKIKLAEGYGPNISANDYRDQRNAALDRLSELIPINYYENKYGEVTVTLNGRDLINGHYFNPIDVKLNPKGHGEIHWSDTGEPIDLRGLGELGGYIDARDKVVVEYKERLNVLVGELASSINALHKIGVDLEGELNGENFFIIGDPKDPAATIKVNPALEDFNKIAVGGSAAKGDGDIAKAILDLRGMNLFRNYEDYISNDDKYIYEELKDENGNDFTNIEDIINEIKGKGGTTNTDGFYRDLILSLSLEREQARDMVLNQVMLINQIDERRQEISSVSLDEEMANMLKYQHSYIANSRVINAIDEMIETIVNRLGIVGR